MATRDKKETRVKIIEAANDLFYRQGFQATTIDQVIEKSGVSRPTVYAHFSTKEELCCAYLNERKRQELDWMKAACKKAGTPMDKYLAVIRTVEEVLKIRDYRGCGFFNMISEIPEPSHPIVQEARRFVDLFRELVRDGVVDLKNSDPKYRDLDVDAVAEAYYLLVGGAIMACQEYREPWPAERAVLSVRDLVEK